MIAILGATGLIGRSLARRIAETDLRPLTLFARTPERLTRAGWPGHVTVETLERFDASQFTLIINALGAGDPGRVAALGAELFRFTREWDERVLARLGQDARYVFLSSGAVYGGSTETAVADAALPLPINRLDSVPAYTAAKLACELRHRFEPERAILDLRVFGYADAGLDTEGAGFLAHLAKAVTSKQPLLTSSADMVRDYAGSEELWALIAAWEGAGAPAGPLDLYTQEPVSKRALIAEATARFGLQVRYVESAAFAAPTGVKPVYASMFHRAGELGYAPRRDAAQVALAALEPFARS